MGANGDAQLSRLKGVVAGARLPYVDLQPMMLASAVAVGPPDAHLVVTVVEGQHHNAFLTCGILRDTNRDRGALLEVANSRTWSNPAYPVFLHDAEAGWDLLMQVSYPIQLLLDVPPFFIGLLRRMPAEANQARQHACDSGIAGHPYLWGTDNLARLHIRSFM